MTTLSVQIDVFLALLSLVLNFGSTSLTLRFLKTGFQDHPNHRSMHTQVTPKTGGLTILPVVTLVLALRLLAHASLYADSGASPMHGLVLVWLACSLLIYALCVISDRSTRELPALVRLTGFFAASAGFAAGLWSIFPGPSAEWVSALTTLDVTGKWNLPARLLVTGFVVFSMLSFTNFYNFMDGIDGLAGSMGLIGFGTLAGAAWMAPDDAVRILALAATALALCCLAFLRWNWPKASIFMGDTGSTVLGFSAAALGWAGSAANVWHWSFPFLVFFPFWFDAGMTLLKRLFQGKKIWHAHREHLYQRAMLIGRPAEMPAGRSGVLVFSIGLMLISALAAALQQRAWHEKNVLFWQPFCALLVIHVGVALWVRRHDRLAHSPGRQASSTGEGGHKK